MLMKSIRVKFDERSTNNVSRLRAKRLLCLSLPIAMIVSLTSPAVSASTSTNKNPDCLNQTASLLKEKGIDGSKVVSTMLDRTKQLKAYTFDSVLSTFINGKEVVETGKLYFKSPNLIRFEAKRAGKRSGSVVVRQRDGKIRGKMGGALGGIKVTLSPDSKLLRTSNGFSIMDSDLASLLSLAVEKMKVNNCLTGQVEGVSSPVVELVETDGDVIYRMALDAANKLPEHWSLFKGDALFSTVQFANLQILADLPEALFTFAKDVSDETTAGERGGSMSLSEYRLQCDNLRRNLLVDSLKELDSASSLNALSYQKLQEGSGLLHNDVEALNPSVVLIPDCDAWATGGPETVVSKTTQMELVLSALGQLGKLEKFQGNEEQKTIELNKWKEALSSCRDAVARIIDEIETDAPKSAEYTLLISELEDRVTSLQEASSLFDQ